MTNTEKIRKALAEKGMDAILLISPKNRYYATGFPSSDGAAVITAEGAYFFTDSRYIEAAEKAITGYTLGLVDNQKRISTWVKELIADLSIKKLGLEEKYLTYSEYTDMEKAFEVQLMPASEIPLTLRECKEKWEVENICAAQAIAEKALDDVLGLIKPGVTEREIAAELTYRMLKYGAEGNSFDPIVVTGAKSSMPHGVPGDEKIQSGDFVTMDFGCLKNGYCSDMTRTVAVGHVTDEMKKVYDIVLQAQLAGIEKAAPGVTGREIDEEGRAVIREAGYGKYFGHGFGHSLGLDIHEAPNASPSCDRPMPEGAVISAEPGIYLPGRFGVRIEDMLHLTGNGCVNLTKAPKELIIL